MDSGPFSLEISMIYVEWSCNSCGVSGELGFEEYIQVAVVHENHLKREPNCIGDLMVELKSAVEDVPGSPD